MSIYAEIDNECNLSIRKKGVQNMFNKTGNNYNNEDGSLTQVNPHSHNCNSKTIDMWKYDTIPLNIENSPVLVSDTLLRWILEHSTRLLIPNIK